LIKVRQATEHDLEFVLQLNQQNVPMVSSVDATWLQKYLKAAHTFAVATFDDKPAGFIIGMAPECEYQSENFLWFKQRYTDFLYVDRLAVLTGLEGKGVGRSLYQYVQSAGTLRFKSITCEVNVRPFNERSYKFHQSLGFAEVGQQETKGGALRVAMLVKPISPLP
jgi:uncharacterized protein